MTGTIVTRTLANGKKRYIAVWRVEGKQKWRTFHKQHDATRFLAGAVKSTHEGTYQDVTPTLMAVVFDDWLTALDTRVKQQLLKPSTAKSYRSMLTMHLRPAFGDIRSDRLRPAVVEHWARARADEIAEGTLAPKTFNNIVNVLSSILTWARRSAQAYLAHDPLIDIERLPKSKIERAFLEPSEITALLTAADDVRDSTILATFAYAGLRRGETFGLKWGDIDWTDGRVSVSRSLYQGVITTPKTDHSIRYVDVPGSLLATWAIYRGCYPSLSGGFIFRTDGGAPLDPDNWSKRCFARIVARAEVRRIGLHGLRHTYASLLINQGENLKYVSQQLGHATIAITADLYGHLFRGTRSAAMDRLDAGFGRAERPRGQVVQIRG